MKKLQITKMQMALSEDIHEQTMHNPGKTKIVKLLRDTIELGHLQAKWGAQSFGICALYATKIEHLAKSY